MADGVSGKEHAGPVTLQTYPFGTAVLLWLPGYCLIYGD